MSLRTRVLPVTIVVASTAIAAVLAWFNVADSATEATFDHFATAFRLEGAHRFAECESCHANGAFAGTPTDCVDCHSQSGQIRATYQPPTHLPVSRQCDACHRPQVWDVVVRVDHLEVVGSCSSCHDNRIVAGQHPQHIPTSGECDTCHNTFWWR